MNAAFFDTNIIAYAADTRHAVRDRSNHARKLMQTRLIAISTQVMMELYAVLTRKLGFGSDAAQKWIETLRDEAVIAVSPRDVVKAIEVANQYKISHWDGLILVAAERAGSHIIYSEDLNHGQAYGSVRVCNPFIEDFLAEA